MANNIELTTQLTLRTDTGANWETENPVLAEGEAGFDITAKKLKIGDGTSAWKALKFIGGDDANHYETIATSDADDIAAITAAVNGTELHDGDTAVVKHLISGEKYSYTAYVYENGAWKAMDGNYSANNVYFDTDFTYTAAIGAITAPSGGSGTLTAAGKNLTDFMTGLLAKEQEPSVTQPSVSIKPSETAPKYFLVGSEGTMTTTTTFSNGNYTYGYIATADNTLKSGSGVTATAYEVSDSSSSVAPTITTNNATGTIKWTATDEKQSCKVIGTVTYTGTPGTPVTNLKKASTKTNPIASGSKSTSALEIGRSYIPAYYGFKYPAALHATPSAISSDDVQKLGSSVTGATAYSRTRPTSFKATGTWQQFFVAIPTTWGTTTPSAKDSNNLALTVEKGTAVTITFGSKTYTYNVFYINLAAGYDTTQITLAW